jgi:hypothetical protein
VESNAKNSPRKALSKVVLGLFAFQRSTPLANETTSLIEPLQILRGAAAVAVATAHIPQIGTFLPISRYGAVGVDVFFVISGFVMVHSSRDLFGTADGYKLFWPGALLESFRFIGSYRFGCVCFTSFMPDQVFLKSRGAGC